MTYSDFLARKAIVSVETGILDPLPLSPKLKGHQTLLTRWALRRGRAAVFADTGLGKGWVALEWARCVAEYTSQPVLILAPLAVSQQFQREAAIIGNHINVCSSQAEVLPGGVNVTNYQKLHRFDPSAFGGVVLDECFARGTRVSVVCEDGAIVSEPIETICVGDRIYNASGSDVVSDVHRREVPYAVRVRANDSTVICSPNHPFFTQRGWVGAQDLVPGDRVLRIGAAVRMVRDNVCPEIQSQEGAPAAAVLREVLLSEMADAPAGDCRQGSLAGGRSPTWAESFGLVEVRGATGKRRDRTDSTAEPDIGPGSTGEDLSPIESDSPRSFRAWGQRAWFDQATTDSSGCAWAELDGGVCLVTGPTDSRLSDALQARLSQQRGANRHRGGWQLAPCGSSEGSGSEKGREAAFAWVDGVEILEPGHPDLERLRAADGKLYFYDLGGTRHPSFSVNGLLVHNSSILKSLDGSTRIALIDSFRHTPFKLSATATPSPNDHTELGGQAEFLGIMSQQEMLATWFVHDGGSTQDWRLKGHARDAFWRWCCSWGAIVKMPSDIGESDDGYVLPELRYHEHIIPATQEDARKSGLLFAAPAETLGEQRDARRGSLDSRCALAAKIANETEGQVIVWCDLNAESEMLARLIPNSEEVTGSQPDDQKEAAIGRFLSGASRVLISKPSICGWGLNFQMVSTVVFCGVTHSWEAFYQAVRRTWRFGQLRPVDVHIISSELEGRVVENLKAKQRKADELAEETRGYVSRYVREAVTSQGRETIPYKATRQIEWPPWLRSEAR